MSKITSDQAKRKRAVLEQFFANAIAMNYKIQLSGLRGTTGTAVTLSEIVDDGFKIIGRAKVDFYQWHILNIYDDHNELGSIIITNSETNLHVPKNNALLQDFIKKTMGTPYRIEFDPSLPYGRQKTA